MSRINTVAELEALYGQPSEASLVKEAPALTPEYCALIDASPFLALATSGPGGLDCSPRGDKRQVAFVEDDRTLILPDRRGNNRADSLKNIIADPRVGLIFLIPGSGTTLRVNGTAEVRTDADLLDRFTVEGQAPRSVIVVHIEVVYFQCARAIVRAALWDVTKHVDPKSLPTPGKILASLSTQTVGGDEYDKAWPARAAKTMW